MMLEQVDSAGKEVVEQVSNHANCWDEGVGSEPQAHRERRANHQRIFLYAELVRALVVQSDQDTDDGDTHYTYHQQ